MIPSNVPRLPNELWINIVKQVPRADLPNLSRTSKQLHEVTEELLYSEFETARRTPRYGTTPSFKKVFTRFLRTILERPSLAKLVKHVTIRFPMDLRKGLPTGSDMSFITSDQKSWLRHEMRAIDAGTWETAFYGHNPLDWFDAAVAFLIHLFSRSVESVTLLNQRLSRYHHTNAVLRRAAILQKQMVEGAALSHLRSVRIWSCKSLSEPSVNIIVPFLRLDSVKELVCHKTQGSLASPALSAPSQPWSSLSDIQSIEFRNNQNSIVELAALFRSFKALKRLGWVDRAEDISELLSIISVNTRLQANLEELIFDQREEFCWFEPLPVYNLSRLTALKILAIDYMSWTPQDLCGPTTRTIEVFVASLPSSLERLKISRCRGGYALYGVEHIVSYKKTTLPNLKQLTFGFDDADWCSATSQMLVDSASRCSRELGITFSAVYEKIGRVGSRGEP
ncbi:uncharacterized protein LY89DRAFT_666837 [Mollisia scopiformis]|uniref:F-box domain-containing protein n=1 Tax=Mollisia scopiformis TaxID=149040 RepID=A0A194XIM0_MOLSC|nr:uncharacterized protein LY89DRAFT_666837 [Mollisia scopiformis]KUJ20008.1 hypothetical protein LY89DRAFT_666837 [Mollisia scopiformis]